MNELLPLVIAGHLIGDWIFQTDRMAANKMLKGIKGFEAMLGHVATYTLAMALCIGWLWNDGSPTLWKAYVILGVSAATHWIIDLRWPVRWLMRVTGSPNFSKSEWGVIATDQALHLSILCILVAAVGR